MVYFGWGLRVISGMARVTPGDMFTSGLILEVARSVWVKKQNFDGFSHPWYFFAMSTWSGTQLFSVCLSSGVAAIVVQTIVPTLMFSHSLSGLSNERNFCSSTRFSLSSVSSGDHSPGSLSVIFFSDRHDEVYLLEGAEKSTDIDEDDGCDGKRCDDIPILVYFELLPFGISNLSNTGVKGSFEGLAGFDRWECC